MATAQEELDLARRDLKTAQNDAEKLRTADENSGQCGESAASVSVALQQRDAAVAAEVAAVARAQTLQVPRCFILLMLLIDKMCINRRMCLFYSCNRAQNTVMLTICCLYS